MRPSSDRAGRMAPLTGGLALALMVLATLVAQAQTTTESKCSLCMRREQQRASWDTSLKPNCVALKSDPKTAHQYPACLMNHAVKTCNESGKCPSNDPVNTSETTACTGMNPPGSCELNDASGPCDDSWGHRCTNSTGAVSQCYDKQVDPKLHTATNCHVSCACK